jgi:hypothetical protein
MSFAANRSVRLSLLAVAVAFTAGCSPGWRVMRVSGPPSALRGAGEVAVAFDYSMMSVEGRTENDWVAAKTAEDAQYPATWADLKGKFEAAVLFGLRDVYPAAHPITAGGQTQVVVWVQVRAFQLGKYIPFVMPRTVVDAEVVYVAGGQPVEEISVLRQYPPSVVQPSVFQHIGPVGQSLGVAAGRYLNSRQ